MSTLLSIVYSLIALAVICACAASAWPAHWPDPLRWAVSAPYRRACRDAEAAYRVRAEQRDAQRRALIDRREAHHG